MAVPVADVHLRDRVGRRGNHQAAAAYLRMLAAGLAEAHGWTTAQIVGYLVALPGVVSGWTSEMLESACSGPDAPALAGRGGR